MPETLGAGGIDVDLALDPLEGRGVVARGGNGAISMIVAAEPGKLRRLPDMYMRTIAAGPLARGRISLLAPVDDNVRAIAEAFGRNVGDVTTIVLDRDPRGRCTHQADPGRNRDCVHLRRDPRYE